MDMQIFVRDLLNACVYIRDTGPNKDFGICANIGLFISGGSRTYVGSYKSAILKSIFRKWPEFSGDFAYPIGSVDTDCDQFYHVAWVKGILWDESTEYGQARIRLLHFCIAELESMIAEYERQSKAMKPFVY